MREPDLPTTTIKRSRKAPPPVRVVLWEEHHLHFFVHLHYLPEDDSFILHWLLPLDKGPGTGGEKPYTNPEEAARSYLFCAREILRLKAAA